MYDAYFDTFMTINQISKVWEAVYNSVAEAAVTTDYALPFVAALVTWRDKPVRILDFGGGWPPATYR